MKTPKEITQQAEELYTKMSSEDDLLVAVNKIIEDIKAGKYDDEDEVVISKIAYKLSVLMFGLGRYVAKYTTLANSAYIYRKFKSATEYKAIRGEGEKMTVRIMDSEVELRTEKYYENQIMAQYYADVIKTLYDECDRFVMVLLSRAKNVSREKINSTLQV